jgi:hypothetical protein
MTDGADRALAPVVGKTLEVALVVLFLGLLTTTLYGGVVPNYRDTAGREVGDRTLALAAERVQQAVPAVGTAVSVTHRVDLPRTIRGRAYRVEADGRTLVLVHPSDAVGGRESLVVPARVTRVEGAWHSREPAVIRVSSTDGGLVVELVEGEG